MFKIVSKQKIAPKEFDMWVEAPRIAGHAKAGQFVVLRVNDMGERIPLTIADHDEEKGPSRSSARRPRLCRASSPAKPFSTSPARSARPARLRSTALCSWSAALGGRTSSLVVMKDECAKYSDELIVTTDDGSEGMKGVVTDAMKMVVERGEKVDRCWCIGPSIMMKFGTKAAKELGLPIWVSLNPLMVDGTGMCGCCRVTVDGKIFFACVDGPEFDGHKVNWDEFMSRMRQYKTKRRFRWTSTLKK